MARPGPSKRGQLHTWRYLGVLAAIFAILYTTVAFAGSDGVLKPKLGLDLKGGAQVILTPKSENGKSATADQLATAVEILRLRVNGAGVSEAEVLLQGQQIVVQVPGGNRDSIKSVTKAAQLQFRKVIECANLQAAGGCSQLPFEQVPKDLLSTPEPTASTSATPQPSASAVVGTPKPSASPVKRPVSAGLLAAVPTPTPTAKATPTAKPSGTPTPSATGTAAPAAPIVLSGDIYSAEAFAALNCSDPAALAGGAPANPKKQVIACSKDGTEKFHLDVAKVVGTDVKSANVGTDQLGVEVLVNLNFKGAGQDRWTNLTIEACGSNTAGKDQCPTAGTPPNRVAVVLDGVVYSSPSINEPINGPAQISGNFKQKEAQDLVNVLKFGALPLTFVAGDTEVISASLGDDQLRSGLLAGGLGLLAVVIYSLLYYRALGFVTIASLLVSGGLVYACDLHPRRPARVRPVPGRHRRLHRLGRHHRRLVRRLLRTTQGRDQGGAHAAVRGRPGLGPGPAHDPVRQHRVGAGRGAALHLLGRWRARLRVHPRPVHPDRRRRRLPVHPADDQHPVPLQVVQPQWADRLLRT